MRRLLIFALLLLASPAWAQTTIIDHAPINLSGTQRILGVLPAAVNTMTMMLERCTTDRPSFWANPATIITLRSNASTDGGQTWLPWCGFSAPGGIHVKRDATEARQSTVRCSLPEGPARRIELIIEVSGPALVSEVTLVVE